MSGAVPPPAAHPLGRVAGPRCPCFLGAGGVGMGGPAQAHQRALLRGGVACCGGLRQGVPGGSARPQCERCLRPGPCPPQAARPRGGQSVSEANALRAWVCGRGGPAPSLWRACPAPGCAPWGWLEAVLGGVTAHFCGGRLMSGAVPLLAVRLWGRAARTRGPCFPGAACVAWGAQHAPSSLRSCEPALRAVGVAGRRPQEGGALRSWEGRLRSGACPPPAARPRGGLSGYTAHMLSARMFGRGGPALSLWLACPASTYTPRSRLEAVPGKWPPTVVRSLWCQALSLCRPPVPGGG